MTSPEPDARFWRGRSVLVTGHTGFKGAWLATWLGDLGARVHGFALDPPSTPNLFDDADVRSCLATDTRGDLRDADAVAACLGATRPEIVLHLAAQSLVRLSHREPVRTFATNIMGTAHVLEAACRQDSVRAIVIVTSDKCYENAEHARPFVETDALGGHDPYSASKACAEIVTAAWRSSFTASAGAPRVASARAGNVIGAADWAADRLVPDCIRAFSAGRPVKIRHPGAVRPWQHVLDPLAGYLLLARALCSADGERAATGWNFGPGPASEAPVGDVAAEVARLWGAGARVEIEPDGEGLIEAGVLRLDASAARARLGWSPRWDLARSLEMTVAGYRRQAGGERLADVIREQIASHAGRAGAGPGDGAVRS